MASSHRHVAHRRPAERSAVERSVVALTVAAELVGPAGDFADRVVATGAR